MEAKMGGKGSGRSSWRSDEIKEKIGTLQRCRTKNEKSKEKQDNPGNYVPPRAPQTLGPHGQKLWHKVVRGWRLDDGELFLLERACEAMDELKTAHEVLARVGETTINKDGQEIPHPCTALRKEARLALLRFWDKLNLDHSPLED
jgi:phage terminase small subunit